MSRNSSISRGSDEALARAIAIWSMLMLFDEAIRRHRDGDLARLRLDEIGEHEHGAVDEAADDSERHDEAEQARHGSKNRDVRLTITFAANWQGAPPPVYRTARRGTCPA